MSRLTVSRRRFLALGAGAGAGLTLGLSHLGLRGPRAAAGGRPVATARGYGPLVSRAAENNGQALLGLPAGFRYTAFGRTGTRMADGLRTPHGHDGMAAFASADGIRVLRNHEVRSDLKDDPGYGKPAVGPFPYDGHAGGGVTTLVVDPETRLLVRDFLSLSGTLTNCGGGATPSGSFLTCEESTMAARDGFERRHGYAFELPVGADSPVPAEPLRAMGRFWREAITMDPRTGIVYQTEDRPESGLYRFLPDDPARLAVGGRLQMLAVNGKPEYDSRSGQGVERALPVTWVDIDDPDPSRADTNSLAVFEQGVERGGAKFARLEGVWHDAGGDVYFTATIGGDAGMGQVWRYRPAGAAEGQLALVFESPGPDVLNMPDGLGISPRGALLLCEDGEEGQQFVRGLTTDGRIFDFIRNDVPGSEHEEFAGAAFSPDGATLFVNVQEPGITFVIWGPWGDGPL